MNNQEIKTITSAMVAKQTWVRKSLNDFLQIWAKITDKEISGHKAMELYKFYICEETEKKLFLVRGKTMIAGGTFNPYSEEWETWDYYLDLENCSIARIRRIITAINKKLPEYFKNIQADIDILSEEGQKINSLIEKLS